MYRRIEKTIDWEQKYNDLKSGKEKIAVKKEQDLFPTYTTDPLMQLISENGQPMYQFDSYRVVRTENSLIFKGALFKKLLSPIKDK